MEIMIVYLFGYAALRGIPYIMRHLDMKIETAIRNKVKVYGTISAMVICNIHSLLMLTIPIMSILLATTATTLTNTFTTCYHFSTWQTLYLPSWCYYLGLVMLSGVSTKEKENYVML